MGRTRTIQEKDPYHLSGRGVTSSTLIDIGKRAWHVELHSLDHKPSIYLSGRGANFSRIDFRIPPLSPTDLAWNDVELGRWKTQVELPWPDTGLAVSDESVALDVMHFALIKTHFSVML